MKSITRKRSHVIDSLQMEYTKKRKIFLSPVLDQTFCRYLKERKFILNMHFYRKAYSGLMRNVHNLEL